MATIETDDWYTLTPDVWMQTIGATYPSDFESPIIRAIVLDGPSTEPFGITLATVQLFGILTNRGIEYTMQDVVSAVDRLLQRGVYYRVVGENRGEYIKATNQVPPMSEGGAGFGEAVSATAVPVIRQGPQGAQGNAGETGSVGPQGPTGATGPTGAVGAAGADGVPGAAGADGTPGDAWETVYDGDFASAATTDLTAGTNPTVSVSNSAGPTPAAVVWTSNAGDATGSVTQVAVSGFTVTNGTGLSCRDDGSTAMSMTSTSHTGPHVWASWADLLGAPPAPGTRYCVMLHIDSENIGTNDDAVYVASYNPNDSVAPSEIDSNVARNDEKRIWSALAHDGTRVVASMREGSTDRTEVWGSRLPTGYNVVALMFNSGVQVDAGVGVYDGGWPEPTELTRVASWLGQQLGFTSTNYLDPEERIAVGIAGPGADLTVNIRRIQVLRK